jgi:hypothetical protein
VFPEAVTNLTRKLDFERAGIAPLDDQGRVADLHGLRATLGTRLARAGVAPQIAQRIMRHADYRTTLQHYTVLSLADTAAAVRRLPGGRGESAATGKGSRAAAVPDADCVSSAGGSSGFPTAGAVVSAESISPSQQNRQQSTHDSARDVTTTCDDECEPSGDDPGPNDRSGRKLREEVRRPARLRSVRGGRRKLLPNPLGNDCSTAASVDGQGLAAAPSPPSADSPAVEGRRRAAECGAVRQAADDLELAAVGRAWPKLTRQLKAAILALIRASTDEQD